MASKVIIISALVGLSVAVLISAQSTTIQPDELHRKDSTDNNNNNQQGATDDKNKNDFNNNNNDQNLVRPDNGNNNNNNNNDGDEKNGLTWPSIDDQNQNQNEQERGNNFPLDPFGIFEPRQRPDRRHRGLFDFFQNPMEHFNRHHRMMDDQFRKLEQQAAEGTSTSIFYRNGVGYKKVCTIERIQPQQQQQQQESLSTLPSQ